MVSQLKSFDQFSARFPVHILVDLVVKVNVGDPLENVVKKWLQTEFFPNQVVKQSLQNCDQKDMTCNEDHQRPKVSWTKNVGEQCQTQHTTQNLELQKATTLF